jgi:putative selenate reductase
MSELVPVPLDLQLHRAFLEYEREGRIFHLPKEKFFSGLPGLDTSVVSNGHRASTPLGPAAGPHTQLLQNIVLCWLAGSRIIELKTVQVLDELKIPRPCIDSENITYNVEWSQELKLDQSLREYVSAAMFLRVLKESNLLGDRYPAACDDTIFDMSIGYNLEGIRSPQVRAWIEGMKDASRIIAELRPTLTGRFRQYRDLPFAPRISDTITLSTFHGCPPEEIEGIVTFLLTEMGLNVCVKMNPTLLGKAQVEHLLHDVLGYQDIELTDDAFDTDLKFSEALDLIPRLHDVARMHGRELSVKFSNTLVVRNHRRVFSDQLMYMSGPALHVLTLNLVEQFRDQIRARIPISFSAGLTAQNVADMVAMNFVPVTTCTDLLKPGGYGRLHNYLESLGHGMRSAGARTISEFVVLHAGQGHAAVAKTADAFRHFAGTTGDSRVAEAWINYDLLPKLMSWMDNQQWPLGVLCEGLKNKLHDSTEPPSEALMAQAKHIERLLVDAAGLLNTPLLVERATVDPRYRWERNKTSARKTGASLSLYDCIACDKCVAICPNAANFVYDTAPSETTYTIYRLLAGGKVAPESSGIFALQKGHQFANYADACNDCGNCDIACPESGGPNVAKPRFFGTLETYRRDTGPNKFFVEFRAGVRTIHGAIGGQEYKLDVDETADSACFTDSAGEYVIQPSKHHLVSWRPHPTSSVAPQRLDMLPYLQLKLLLDSVSEPHRVTYVNVARFQGVTQ